MYAAKEANFIQAFEFQTISMVSPYEPTGLFGTLRNCIKIGVTDSGIYITAIFPFNLGAPPVIIPWNEFTINEQISYFGYCEISPTKLPELTIILRGTSAGEISSIYRRFAG